MKVCEIIPCKLYHFNKGNKMTSNEEAIKLDANRRGVPIIREESHKILQGLTEKINPKTILEIGTAVGYSGILMLSSAKDASLITIEHDISKVEEARNNFKNEKLDNRATVVYGDCLEEVSLMVAEGKYDKYFDMVFLDGPKAQYINMLESLILMTKSGGYIIADNVLFRGYVKNKETMPRRFKTIVKRLEMLFETVKNHPDIESHQLIEIEDGILVIKIK